MMMPILAASGLLAALVNAGPLVNTGPLFPPLPMPPAPPERPAAVWVSPVTPSVVERSFRAPSGPYGAGHRGVDLAARPGQVVKSAGPGRVVVARPIAGRWVISVVHPMDLAPLPGGHAWRTTYEGVKPTVGVGQQVRAGAVIGTLAGGGHADGLHWGLKSGRIYVDPMTLLRRPVVLKPWIT